MMPTAMPHHPLLSLPQANDAIRDSVANTTARMVAATHFKLDTSSLARFVRLAHDEGWLSGAQVARLTHCSAAGQFLALHDLAEQGAAYMAKRTDLSAAMTPEAMEKVSERVGSTSLDASGVKALGHLAIEAGLTSHDAMLTAMRNMNDLHAHLLPWFIKLTQTHMAQEVATNLGLDAAPDTLNVEITAEGWEDGALLALDNNDWLSLFHMRLPTGNGNHAVMLRDTLCLMDEVLSHLGVFHHGMDLTYGGGYHAGEDNYTLLEQLDGDAPTEANITRCLRKVLLTSLEGAGSPLSDVEHLSLDDLLERDDATMMLGDFFPLLFTFFMSGRTHEEWIDTMVDMLADNSWSARDSFLPPHLTVGAGRESSRERDMAIATYLSEHVAALREVLGDTIPETVAELARIAGWLEHRAEKGTLDVYLEDQEAEEGTPFEMSFITAPCVGEPSHHGMEALSPSEVATLCTIEMENDNVGTAPRQAIAVAHDPCNNDTARKLLEIGATYATFSEAMTRLSKARERESCKI